MKWKKMILVGSVAFTALMISATAATRDNTITNARPSNRTYANNSTGHWNGNWNRHDRYRWHYNPYSFYFGSGYGYGYPYYGSGLSYGIGFGYQPYGYGYYGSSYGYQPYGGGYYTDGRPSGYQQVTGGSVVARVQQRLAHSGYYRGAIDGVAGYGTRNAIRAFERDHGLRVDGRIDGRLLSRLGVA